MANVFYKQCILQKRKGIKPEVITQQTAWIPEVFAHVGRLVELKGDNGWEVVAVAQQRLDAETVSEQSQDYKHQRKASDI